jgi:hypothetical protein
MKSFEITISWPLQKSRPIGPDLSPVGGNLARGAGLWVHSKIGYYYQSILGENPENITEWDRRCSTARL